MKRTLLLLRWYAGAASVMLTLSLFASAGCSGSVGSDGAGEVAGKYGLSRSDLIALKKANKNPEAFKKAVLKQKIEKLKAQGVVIDTTTPGKTAKSGR